MIVEFFLKTFLIDQIKAACEHTHRTMSGYILGATISQIRGGTICAVFRHLRDISYFVVSNLHRSIDVKILPSRRSIFPQAHLMYQHHENLGFILKLYRAIVNSKRI